MSFLRTKELSIEEISPDDLILIDTSCADRNKLVSLPFDGSKHPVYLQFIFSKLHVLAMIERDSESGLWGFSIVEGCNDLFVYKGYPRYRTELSEAMDRIYGISSKNICCIDLNRLSQSGVLECLGLKPYIDYIPNKQISEALESPRFTIRYGRHKFFRFTKQMYQDSLSRLPVDTLESLPRTLSIIDEQHDMTDEMDDFVLADFESERHILCLAIIGQFDRVTINRELELIEDVDCSLTRIIEVWIREFKDQIKCCIDYSLSNDPLDLRGICEYKLSDMLIYKKHPDAISISMFGLVKTLDPLNRILITELTGYIIVLAVAVESYDWSVNPKTNQRVNNFKAQRTVDPPSNQGNQGGEDDDDTEDEDDDDDYSTTTKIRTTTTTTTTTTKPPTTTTTTTTQYSYCNDDSDCSELPCMIAYCSNQHTCQYEEVICEVPENNQCVGTYGCDEDTEYCHYFEISCNDHNPCTMDHCVRNQQDPSNVTCRHDVIQNCDKDCAHQVNITIEDISELTVHTYGEIVELCHTSTYFGPNHAVVLGFDPYQSCNMNERGTCDNLISQYDTEVEGFCGSNASPGVSPCISTIGDKGVVLMGLSQTILWEDTPIFVENDESNSAHLHGRAYDPYNSGLTLLVDIWFYGKQATVTSPLLEMQPNCYSHVVNVSAWHGYTTLSGSIVATLESPYHGLSIALSGGQNIQIGDGANGQNSNYGMTAHMHWTISHQPYDDDLQIEVSESSMAIVYLNLESGCSENATIDYCSYFEELGSLPANGWIVSIHDGNITYCRNFTVEELIHCHNFSDSHSSLFSVVNSQMCNNGETECEITYYGTLYETTVNNENCAAWPDVCDEEIVGSACYNVTVSIDASGTSEISYYATGFDFELHWLGNVWLCGDDRGNLKVKLRTRVMQRGDNNTTHLCNPWVDHDEETGYPIDFDLTELPGNTAEQIWVLRTVGAENVIDFSGVKPLRWNVCVGNGTVVDHVSATLNLNVRHTGDQAHLDGKVDAAVALYTDRQLSHQYAGQTLVDCDHLYGEICLTNHLHLDIILNKATICFSHSRDLIPFDPLQPNITGCNTPGDDVNRIVVYDLDEDVDDEFHNFELIFNPPTLSSCDGFVFKVRAYTQYSQIIQIRWCAQENGGNGGLIGMISEYSTLSQKHAEHDEEDHSFIVDCPHSWYYDWDLYECRAHNHWDDHHHWWWILIVLIITAMILICCCFNVGPWLNSGPASITNYNIKSKSKTSHKQKYSDNENYVLVN